MRLSSIGKGLRQTPLPTSRFCEHLSSDNDQSFSCRQRIYVMCPHCQRSLCLDHINEHQLLIRLLFDSLVNRLNEYRYELTVALAIPTDSQTLVNNCLDEFRTVIMPYVQRTCCQNDVKQDDINRIQMFLDKMQTIIQHVQFNWETHQKETKQSRSSKELDNTESTLTSNKRFRTDTEKTIIILE